MLGKQGFLAGGAADRSREVGDRVAGQPVHRAVVPELGIGGVVVELVATGDGAHHHLVAERVRHEDGVPDLELADEGRHRCFLRVERSG